MQLSAVIIAFNEEQNLPRCLQSLTGVADEVVVVDSFSADTTVAIAQSYGAKVVQHTFEGHIQQKNYALTQATNQYCLSLDADEALSGELRAEILDLKNKGFTYAGYTMPRLTNYCGQWIKHTGWYPDRKLRLFDKTLGAWGGLNPHDRYELPSNATTLALHGDILHYSYHSIAQHYKQAQNFAGITAQSLHQVGKKATWFHLLFSPVIKFVKYYIFKLGFLDGKAGYTISRISAWATYLKYKQMLTLQKQG